MTGSLRSLAWLAGLDELVEATDDPAYLIEDDIEIGDNPTVAIGATHGRRNPSAHNPG